MGWFWRSEASKPPPPAQSPPEPKERPQASNVDPEVEKFLALFQEDQERPSKQQQQQPTPTPRNAASTRSSSSSPTPSSWFSWPSSSQPTGPPLPPSQHTSTSTPPPTAPDATSAESDDPALSPLATSLLPTTMNCRQRFDMAWACQSPVGQWRAVYRYGTARDCSELWSDFWFCMRIKGHAGGPESKAEKIRARFAAKEHAKYGPGQPSSEDVWASREEKVELGTVMNVPLEDTTRRGEGKQGEQ